MRWMTVSIQSNLASSEAGISDRERDRPFFSPFLYLASRDAGVKGTVKERTVTVPCRDGNM